MSNSYIPMAPSQPVNYNPTMQQQYTTPVLNNPYVPYNPIDTYQQRLNVLQQQQQQQQQQYTQQLNQQYAQQQAANAQTIQTEQTTQNNQVIQTATKSSVLAGLVANLEEAQLYPIDLDDSQTHMLMDSNEGVVYTKRYNPKTGGSILRKYKLAPEEEQPSMEYSYSSDKSNEEIAALKTEVNGLKDEIKFLKGEIGNNAKSTVQHESRNDSQHVSKEQPTITTGGPNTKNK